MLAQPLRARGQTNPSLSWSQLDADSEMGRFDRQEFIGPSEIDEAEFCSAKN